jgi:PAS domain S-box-containing protein
MTAAPLISPPATAESGQTPEAVPVRSPGSRALKAPHSVRRKLTRMIMLTSATAVLLSSLGFVSSDLLNLRTRLSNDLSILAQVVGTNSLAAITFADQQGAEEVLSALHSKPSIIAAGIYTAGGVPFARFQPNPGISIPARLPADGFHDLGNRLELCQAIMLRHKRVGTLYIASDSRERDERFRQYAEIATVVVIASLLFAFALSSRLQRTISQPIVELARVATSVSRSKDYSMRANPRGLSDGDEIDHLMMGFNTMLAEIEQRDQKLLLAMRAAEEAGEISNRLARESALILNSTTDGIFGVNQQNQVMFLNAAATRLLGGMSVADMEGRTIHEAIHHSRPDGTPWAEDECENTQALRRGELITGIDDVFWRKDGTSFPVEYGSTPMLADDGTKIGAVVIFRDVAERRMIERMKNEFVSTVSHELRTPLTSIRGALGLLGSGLVGEIAQKGQRMLDIAVVNTDRLVRLIDDILDLERINSGKVEFERSSVAAELIMTQATEGLQAMADAAGICLRVIPESERLWGDSDRIIQTLTNLLGNAVKFSPAGSNVTLTGFRDGLNFVFCVADEGRGVPDDKRESIFVRFNQVDTSDSREKGGSGLGLAICQNIVHAHEGRIWCEKNEPAGTRFLFTIPLATPSQLELEEKPAPLEAPPGSELPKEPIELAGSVTRTLLVIDDEEDLREVIRLSLERMKGWKVHTAISGAAGIAIALAEKPDAILLDVMMPEMDGPTALRILRDQPATKHIPVIFVTAKVQAEDRLRYMQLGASGMIPKPFDPLRLAQQVNDILAWS